MIGAHIGPEPTTDKWVAVMKSDQEDLVIPGNAAAVQADKPFNGLSRFGSSFLSKFQVQSHTHIPIDHIIVNRSVVVMLISLILSP